MKAGVFLVCGMLEKYGEKALEPSTEHQNLKTS